MSDKSLQHYQTIEKESALGKQSQYDSSYNPNHLYAIPRAEKRQEIGINPEHLPFKGFDCWTHYEVSWLNEKGKPMVAIGEIIYDCNSINIIESKSMKLYFNSFNNTPFKQTSDLEATIKKDLEERIKGTVRVTLQPLNQNKTILPTFSGESIDSLDVACSVYLVEPSFLSVSDECADEILCSDLLKSNCLVTNQPDWGSVQIAYSGKKINREGLLKYIVSFRNHNEFHEQCIERIFIDIMTYCRPEKLTVYGRYTRRGGLDINPYRTTEAFSAEEHLFRLIRQ